MKNIKSDLPNQENKISMLKNNIEETQNIVNTISETKEKANKIISQIPDPPSSNSLNIPGVELVSPEITEQQISHITEYGKTLGEGHIVYAKVTLDGNEISKENNIQVEITQKVASHDEFEIICPCEAFGEYNAYPLSNSKNLLGKKATIEMVQFGATAYLFIGVITKITNKRVLMDIPT